MHMRSTGTRSQRAQRLPRFYRKRVGGGELLPPVDLWCCNYNCYTIAWLPGLIAPTLRQQWAVNLPLATVTLGTTTRAGHRRADAGLRAYSFDGPST